MIVTCPRSDVTAMETTVKHGLFRVVVTRPRSDVTTITGYLTGSLERFVVTRPRSDVTTIYCGFTSITKADGCNSS